MSEHAKTRHENLTDLHSTLRHAEQLMRELYAAGALWPDRPSPKLQRDYALSVQRAVYEVALHLVPIAGDAAAIAASYPEAHDDDEQAPGTCKCGRWAEQCPARAAAASGLDEWEAEDGQTYPVDDEVVHVHELRDHLLETEGKS